MFHFRFICFQCQHSATQLFTYLHNFHATLICDHAKTRAGAGQGGRQAEDKDQKAESRKQRVWFGLRWFAVLGGLGDFA
jgi:hypothetical protein